ncbi:MAG: helix-turn-helix domain-containing protein [Pseudomonadota bacterium]
MDFGIELARLRRAREWSQEELAARAQLSQRHVSFLETGRSQPGPAALAKLTRAMALKAWEQRALLRTLTAPEDRPAATSRDSQLPDGFLERLSVWPTCAFRPDGTLVESNTALDALLAFASGGRDLWADTAYRGRANLYDLTFHPKGLIRWMANPQEVVPETLRRLRIEATRNADLVATLKRFEAYPSVREWGRELDDPPAVLTERYRLKAGTPSVVCVVSSIASPGELELAALRIETFVPADEASVALLSSLAPRAISQAI